VTEREEEQALDRLGNTYRAIHAPPQLARKVLASVEQHRYRASIPRWAWVVTAGVTAMALVLFNLQPDRPVQVADAMAVPSLGMINLARHGRSLSTVPGLGDIRAVSTLPNISTVSGRVPDPPEPTSGEPEGAHNDYFDTEEQDHEPDNQPRIA